MGPLVTTDVLIDYCVITRCILNDYVKIVMIIDN